MFSAPVRSVCESFASLLANKVRTEEDDTQNKEELAPECKVKPSIYNLLYRYNPSKIMRSKKEKFVKT